MSRRCADCRNGEHPNYDNDMLLCRITDPDTGKLVKRAYLCREHRMMYHADGYRIISIK